MTIFDPARFSSPEEQEEWFDILARTVAFDFDGVLHPYTDGWIGSTPADEEPIPGARTILEGLREIGYRIVVFSTRCDHPEGLAGTIDWLEKYGLLDLVDDVTCQKPAAVAYVDDRAVPFAGSWPAVLVGIQRLAEGRSHGAAPAAAEAPLGRFYVSFGQKYLTEPHPQGRPVHPDGVTLIEAEDFTAARAIADAVYGSWFSHLVDHEGFWVGYYPRGVTARLRRKSDGTIDLQENLTDG